MAQVDFFLKIETPDVPGESTDAKHKGEIDVISWSVGLTNTGTHGGVGLGGGAGKAQFHDFHFVMKVSKASPLLLQDCATGQHHGKATLTCRKAGTEQQEYLKYYFADLLISSFQTAGSPGDVVPTEQITFNFSKIEMEYKEQKPDGSLAGAVKKGYNLAENKKV
jgi:type VI secretion system secreted protein Hcp